MMTETASLRRCQSLSALSTLPQKPATLQQARSILHDMQADAFERSRPTANRPIASSVRGEMTKLAATGLGQTIILVSSIADILHGAALVGFGLLALAHSSHSTAVVVFGVAFTPVGFGLACLALGAASIGLGAYMWQLAADGRALDTAQAASTGSAGDHVA